MALKGRGRCFYIVAFFLIFGISSTTHGESKAFSILPKKIRSKRIKNPSKLSKIQRDNLKVLMKNHNFRKVDDAILKELDLGLSAAFRHPSGALILMDRRFRTSLTNQKLYGLHRASLIYSFRLNSQNSTTLLLDRIPPQRALRLSRAIFSVLQSRKNAFKASKSDHRSPALYEGDLKAHPAGMIEGPDYRLNSPYEPIIGQSFLGCLSNFVDVWELFIMDPTASVARGLQEPLASLALGRDQLEYFFKFYRPSLIRFLAGLPEKVKGVKEMTHHDLAKLWCSFGPGYPLYKHLGKSPVARTPPALAAAAPVPEVLAHAQRSIQSQQAEWAKAQTKKWDDAGDATSELKGGVPTQAQLQQDLGGDDGWQWDIAPKAEREGPRKPVRTLVSYREVEALFPQLKDRKALMLPRIRVGPKIKELSEIPFSLSDEYRAIKTDEMLRRAPNLPPDIQRTILGVYNRLQDKDAMARYFTELFEEAAVHAYRRGREKDLESLRAGAVPFEVLEATVVKRLKDSGDNNFTNLVGYRVVANPEGRRTNRINHREDDNRILHGTRELRNGPAGTPREQFRAAVAQGPFKDDAAPNNTNRAGHGAYSHMIQRDLVSEVIERETGGNSQKFWDFLGSKKGVHWWIDLFDSKDPNSFTQPENITEFMNHYMDQPR